MWFFCWVVNPCSQHAGKIVRSLFVHLYVSGFFFFFKVSITDKSSDQTIFNCSLLRIETYNVNAIRFV